MTAKQKLKGMFAGRTDVISPLMAFIADNHAARLAKLWPAPHEGFFCLPTARRHAAAILCDIAETQHIPGSLIDPWKLGLQCECIPPAPCGDIF